MRPTSRSLQPNATSPDFHAPGHAPAAHPRTAAIIGWVLAAALVAAGARAGAGDWPHWRGPQRNGAVEERSGWTGKQWPIGAPVWTTNVGEGSSSPLVIAQRVLVMGWREGRDTVYCLDLVSGRELWKVSYAAPQYGRHARGDEGLYSGPSSTPEFDGETGLLYTLSIDGELRAWNTHARGELVWAVNLYDQYTVEQRPRVGRSGRRDYGYTASPLVHDNWLIVEVGAAEGNLMAFDKRTGQHVWSSESKSPAGHTGGPAPLVVEGVPCIAVHNFDGLLVARLDAGHPGQTVATYPWRTNFANNIASPAVHQNNVVVTSGYNHHKIARLRITLEGGAEKIWETPQASKVCSPVVHDGHVYWVWQQCYCLDFDTGNVLWQGGRFGDAGSLVVTSDRRLIAWTGAGDLTLIDSATHAPDRFTPLASHQGVGGADAWPHVVVAAGRIIAKDRAGQIVCFRMQQ